MGLVFSLLDPFLSPLMGLGNVLAVFVLTVIITLTSTLLSKKFVNYTRLKEIQAELNEHRKKMMASYKAQDEKETKKLKEDEPRIMQLQQELMQLQYPMFFTIIPVLFIFLWAKEAFVDTGIVVVLPFTLPRWGTSLGWLGWYIMCSMPLTILFRKALKVM